MGRSTKPRMTSKAINRVLGISFFLAPWLEVLPTLLPSSLRDDFLTLLGFVKLTLLLVIFIPLFGVTGCDTVTGIMFWVLSSKQLHRGSRSQAMEIKGYIRGMFFFFAFLFSRIDVISMKP